MGYHLFMGYDITMKILMMISANIDCGYFDDSTLRGRNIKSQEFHLKCVPFGNETWQWKIHNLWMIFPFKPPFIGDVPLPCLMTK